MYVYSVNGSYGVPPGKNSGGSSSRNWGPGPADGSSATDIVRIQKEIDALCAEMGDFGVNGARMARLRALEAQLAAAESSGSALDQGLSKMLADAQEHLDTDQANNDQTAVNNDQAKIDAINKILYAQQVQGDQAGIDAAYASLQPFLTQYGIDLKDGSGLSQDDLNKIKNDPKAMAAYDQYMAALTKQQSDLALWTQASTDLQKMASHPDTAAAAKNAIDAVNGVLEAQGFADMPQVGAIDPSQADQQASDAQKAAQYWAAFSKYFNAQVADDAVHAQLAADQAELAALRRKYGRIIDANSEGAFNDDYSAIAQADANLKQAGIDLSNLQQQLIDQASPELKKELGIDIAQQNLDDAEANLAAVEKLPRAQRRLALADAQEWVAQAKAQLAAAQKGNWQAVTQFTDQELQAAVAQVQANHQGEVLGGYNSSDLASQYGWEFAVNQEVALIQSAPDVYLTATEKSLLNGTDDNLNDQKIDIQTLALFKLMGVSIDNDTDAKIALSSPFTYLMMKLGKVSITTDPKTGETVITIDSVKIDPKTNPDLWRAVTQSKDPAAIMNVLMGNNPATNKPYITLDKDTRTRLQNLITGTQAARLDYVKARVQQDMAGSNPTVQQQKDALDALGLAMQFAFTPEERAQLWQEAGAPYFTKEFFEKQFANIAGKKIDYNKTDANGSGFAVDEIGEYIQDLLGSSHGSYELAEVILSAIKESYNINWFQQINSGGAGGHQRGTQFYEALSMAVQYAYEGDPNFGMDGVSQWAQWLTANDGKGESIMQMISGGGPDNFSVHKAVMDGYGLLSQTVDDILKHSNSFFAQEFTTNYTYAMQDYQSAQNYLKSTNDYSNFNAKTDVPAYFNQFKDNPNINQSITVNADTGNAALVDMIGEALGFIPTDPKLADDEMHHRYTKEWYAKGTEQRAIIDLIIGWIRREGGATPTIKILPMIYAAQGGGVQYGVLIQIQTKGGPVYVDGLAAEQAVAAANSGLTPDQIAAGNAYQEVSPSDDPNEQWHYSSISDYQDNNQLAQSGTIYLPDHVDGIHAHNWGWRDTANVAIGFGTAVLAIGGMVFTGGASLALLAAAGLIGGGWAIYNGADELHNMTSHGESINPFTNGQAFEVYTGIAGGAAMAVMPFGGTFMQLARAAQLGMDLAPEAGTALTAIEGAGEATAGAGAGSVPIISSTFSKAALEGAQQALLKSPSLAANFLQDYRFAISSARVLHVVNTGYGFYYTGKQAIGLFTNWDAMTPGERWESGGLFALGLVQMGLGPMIERVGQMRARNASGALPTDAPYVYVPTGPVVEADRVYTPYDRSVSGQPVEIVDEGYPGSNGTNQSPDKSSPIVVDSFIVPGSGADTAQTDDAQPGGEQKTDAYKPAVYNAMTAAYGLDGVIRQAYGAWISPETPPAFGAVFVLGNAQFDDFYRSNVGAGEPNQLNGFALHLAGMPDVLIVREGVDQATILHEFLHYYTSAAFRNMAHGFEIVPGQPFSNLGEGATEYLLRQILPNATDRPYSVEAREAAAIFDAMGQDAYKAYFQGDPQALATFAQLASARFGTPVEATGPVLVEASIVPGAPQPDAAMYPAISARARDNWMAAGQQGEIASYWNQAERQIAAEIAARANQIRQQDPSLQEDEVLLRAQRQITTEVRYYNRQNAIAKLTYQIGQQQPGQSYSENLALAEARFQSMSQAADEQQIIRQILGTPPARNVTLHDWSDDPGRHAWPLEGKPPKPDPRMDRVGELIPQPPAGGYKIGETYAFFAGQIGLPAGYPVPGSIRVSNHALEQAWLALAPAFMDVHNHPDKFNQALAEYRDRLHLKAREFLQSVVATFHLPVQIRPLDVQNFVTLMATITAPNAETSLGSVPYYCGGDGHYTASETQEIEMDAESLARLDMRVAAAIEILSPQLRERVHGAIAGLDLSGHGRDPFEWLTKLLTEHPLIFAHIAEITFHKEHVEFQRPYLINLSDPTVLRFFDAMVNAGLGAFAMVIHSDWSRVHIDPETGRPAAAHGALENFVETVRVFSDPNRQAFVPIFAHGGGIGRTAMGFDNGPVTLDVVYFDAEGNEHSETVTFEDQIDAMRYLKRRVPQAMFDISWNDVGLDYVRSVRLRERFIQFALDFPDAVIDGSDSVSPANPQAHHQSSNTWLPILAELSQRPGGRQAVLNIKVNNYVRMIDAAYDAQIAWLEQNADSPQFRKAKEEYRQLQTAREKTRESLRGQWRHWMDQVAFNGPIDPARLNNPGFYVAYWDALPRPETQPPLTPGPAKPDGLVQRFLWEIGEGGRRRSQGTAGSWRYGAPGNGNPVTQEAINQERMASVGLFLGALGLGMAESVYLEDPLMTALSNIAAPFRDALEGVRAAFDMNTATLRSRLTTQGHTTEEEFEWFVNQIFAAAAAKDLTAQQLRDISGAADQFWIDYVYFRDKQFETGPNATWTEEQRAEMILAAVGEFTSTVGGILNIDQGSFSPFEASRGLGQTRLALMLAADIMRISAGINALRSGKPSNPADATATALTLASDFGEAMLRIAALSGGIARRGTDTHPVYLRFEAQLKYLSTAAGVADMAGALWDLVRDIQSAKPLASIKDLTEFAGALVQTYARYRELVNARNKVDALPQVRPKERWHTILIKTTGDLLKLLASMTPLSTSAGPLLPARMASSRPGSTIDTADSILQDAFASYLAGKGPAAGRVRILSDTEFAQACEERGLDPNQVKAFVDYQADGAPPVVTLGGNSTDMITVLHELLHYYSSPGFRELASRYRIDPTDPHSNLSEGAAQFLASLFTESAEPQPYLSESIAVAAIAAGMEGDAFFRAYFQGDQTALDEFEQRASELLGSPIEGSGPLRFELSHQPSESDSEQQPAASPQPEAAPPTPSEPVEAAVAGTTPTVAGATGQVLSLGLSALAALGTGHHTLGVLPDLSPTALRVMSESGFAGRGLVLFGRADLELRNGKFLQRLTEGRPLTRNALDRYVRWISRSARAKGFTKAQLQQVKVTAAQFWADYLSLRYRPTDAAWTEADRAQAIVDRAGEFATKIAGILGVDPAGLSPFSPAAPVGIAFRGVLLSTYVANVAGNLPSVLHPSIASPVGLALYLVKTAFEITNAAAGASTLATAIGGIVGRNLETHPGMQRVQAWIQRAFAADGWIWAGAQGAKTVADIMTGHTVTSVLDVLDLEAILLWTYAAHRNKANAEAAAAGRPPPSDLNARWRIALIQAIALIVTQILAELLADGASQLWDKLVQNGGHPQTSKGTPTATPTQKPTPTKPPVTTPLPPTSFPTSPQNHSPGNPNPAGYNAGANGANYVKVTPGESLWEIAANVVLQRNRIENLHPTADQLNAEIWQELLLIEKANPQIVQKGGSGSDDLIWAGDEIDVPNAPQIPGIAPQAGAIAAWAINGNEPGTVLPTGTRLNLGDHYTSPNGEYELVMQYDGDLVLYRNNSNGTQTQIFDTGTYENNPYGLGIGDHAVIQSDGNLVVYTANTDGDKPGDVVWQSNTGSSADAYSVLAIQDDGDLVTYAKDGATWDAFGHNVNGRLVGDSAV